MRFVAKAIFVTDPPEGVPQKQMVATKILTENDTFADVVRWANNYPAHGILDRLTIEVKETQWDTLF